MDLGYYGGSSNGNRKAVSPGNSLLLYWQRKAIRAVDQQIIWTQRQLTDSAAHGLEGCLQDIDTIYFEIIHSPDPNG